MSSVPVIGTRGTVGWDERTVEKLLALGLVWLNLRQVSNLILPFDALVSYSLRRIQIRVFMVFECPFPFFALETVRYRHVFLPPSRLRFTCTSIRAYHVSASTSCLPIAPWDPNVSQQSQMRTNLPRQNTCRTPSLRVGTVILHNRQKRIRGCLESG